MQPHTRDDTTQFDHGIHTLTRVGFTLSFPGSFPESAFLTPTPLPTVYPAAACGSSLPQAMDSKSTQVARNLASAAAPRIDFLSRLLTYSLLT